MFNFGKFVVKSISTTSKGLYSWKLNPNYLITIHFRNTSYNYLHVLVKKTITHRKQMWQVWSESVIVNWLLLLEFGLIQFPILSMQLLGCLTIALQNLLHRLISACISVHPNPSCSYFHPKLKTLPLKKFILWTWKSFRFNNSANINLCFMLTVTSEVLFRTKLYKFFI